MQALQKTVFFTLAMDIADAHIAASMFAIVMGLSILSLLSLMAAQLR